LKSVANAPLNSKVRPVFLKYTDDEDHQTEYPGKSAGCGLKKFWNGEVAERLNAPNLEGV
tara:strand:+ start:884 stop:1063 length:180 start_codon:yes stop_codon:yes gene_type:complete